MVMGGNTWDGSQSYYNGALDDVRVWNRALTDAEVLALFQGPGRLAGGSRIANGSRISH